MSARMDEPLDPTAYARLVRRALADLPQDTVDDLLEDLDEHLAEVAAEDAGSLTARLGPPRVYASELRRAAGLPEPAAQRAARSAPLREAAARLSREPAVRSALGFLVELRPAWWVLRAVAVVFVLTFVLFGATSTSLVLWLPLVVAAVVLSVRLGRRSQRSVARDPRAVLVSRTVNGVLAAVAAVALFAVLSSGSQEVYAEDSPPYPYANGPLAHSDGTPMTNIYPYSSAGQPLSGVLLYDQAGRPISDLADTDEQGRQVSRVLPTDAPPPPGNAFPQAQQLVPVDEYGQPVPPAPVPPAVVPPVVVVPTVAPSPAATPTPTATPSPRATPAAPTTAAPTPTR